MDQDKLWDATWEGFKTSLTTSAMMGTMSLLGNSTRVANLMAKLKIPPTPGQMTVQALSSVTSDLASQLLSPPGNQYREP